MDELFRLPLEVAATLAAGTTAAMSALKKILKGNNKEIPTTWKIPTVAMIAFFASLLWFQAKNSLSWSNWVDILATTAATVFLAVVWHSAQKPTVKKDPRRD